MKRDREATTRSERLTTIERHSQVTVEKQKPFLFFFIEFFFVLCSVLLNMIFFCKSRRNISDDELNMSINVSTMFDKRHVLLFSFDIVVFFYRTMIMTFNIVNKSTRHKHMFNSLGFVDRMRSTYLQSNINNCRAICYDNQTRIYR
jgi:hypothetical protein